MHLAHGTSTDQINRELRTSRVHRYLLLLVACRSEAERYPAGPRHWRAVNLTCRINGRLSPDERVRVQAAARIVWPEDCYSNIPRAEVACSL